MELLQLGALAAVCLLVAGWAFSTTRRVARLEERLQAPAAPAPRQAQNVEVADLGLTIGKATAPVTVVQFTDYQCPFCRRFAVETLPQIVDEYIASGKVRLVIRDLPLTNIHADAETYAHAARCLGGAPDLLAVQHALYENQNVAVDSVLAAAATAAATDIQVLKSCLDTRIHAAAIAADVDAAAAIRVRATPSFVIGATSADGVNGPLIEGAQPYARFAAVIDSVLARQ